MRIKKATFLLVMVLLLGLIGGLFFFFKGKSGEQLNNVSGKKNLSEVSFNKGDGERELLDSDGEILGRDSKVENIENSIKELIVEKDGKRYFKTMFGDIPLKEIEKLSNKYKNMGEFLSGANKLVNNITGLNLDLTKDDFVICIKSGDIIKKVVKFSNKNLKEGYYDIPGYKYKYMYDIQTAIKNNCIAGGYKSSAGYKILLEEDLKHPLSKYVDNIFDRKIQVFKLINELSSAKKLDKNHKQLLGFLYDFVGEYDKAKEIQKEVYTKKTASIIIKGKILDAEGEPIKKAKIVLLNDPNIFTYSNESGEYKLSFKYYPFTYIRIKISKFAYSDGYFSFKLDFSKNPNLIRWYEKKFYLTKAHFNKKINWGVKKPDKVFSSGKYYKFKTSQSTYYVPVNGLHYKNGKKFNKGEVYIFMYEFKKRDKIEDLVNVDTFSPVAGYVGNLMKTFGMPYIQFFDSNGKELFVYKSNPMLVENKIYHMKELYENYDKIYEPVTKEDMEYLYKYSKNKSGYPITYDWLIENNFLRWPVWWTLDRKKGIWVDIPHKVVDPSGVVRFEFWQIDK